MRVSHEDRNIYMEKVINLLNDIEEKANAILDQTSIEKKALYAQLTQKTEEWDRNMTDDTKKKLDVIRRKMDQEVKEAEKTLLSSSDKYMVQMESDFKKNHDTYVEMIFHKIIQE